jgi:hypothetical protein
MILNLKSQLTAFLAFHIYQYISAFCELVYPVSTHFLLNALCIYELCMSYSGFRRHITYECGPLQHLLNGFVLNLKEHRLPYANLSMSAANLFIVYKQATLYLAFAERCRI